MASNYDDIERDALIAELGRPRPRPRNGNTGVSGIGLPGGVEAPPLRTQEFQDRNANGRDDRDEETPAVDYTTVGQFAGKMPRYDAKKLNDPTHQTARYRVGRVLSHFDPSEGITPELLAALNSTVGDAGEWYGEGDKLGLRGNVSAEFDGVGGLDDVIHRFTGPGANPEWAAYTNEIGQAQQRAERNGNRPSASGPGAFQTIQGIAPTDTAFYNSLQNRLVEILGGTRRLDRDALLQLLGAR